MAFGKKIIMSIEIINESLRKRQSCVQITAEIPGYEKVEKYGFEFPISSIPTESSVENKTCD